MPKKTLKQMSRSVAEGVDRIQDTPIDAHRLQGFLIDLNESGNLTDEQYVVLRNANFRLMRLEQLASRSRLGRGGSRRR